MFSGRVVTFLPVDKGAEIDFADCTNEDAATVMARFFDANGFRLEEGTPSTGVYGAGSAGARAVVGGFTKRRKYDIKVTTLDEGVRVDVKSAMSGWSGSLLGVARERSARKQFVSDLERYLR